MKNLLVLGLSLLSTAAMAAECVVVDRVPATLANPGRYCLADDLVAPKAGITITGDNISLDCGGYAIDGSSHKPRSTARGIYAASSDNVRVENCIVKGFAEGIRLGGFGNSIQGNTVIASLAKGIMLVGDAGVISGNRVYDIGGSALAAWGTHGIYLSGSADISENIVAGITPPAASRRNAFGIYATTADASHFSRNIVRNVLGSGGAQGLGLTLHNTSNAVVKENSLINPPESNGFAVQCTGTGNVVAANVFLGFSQGLTQQCSAVANYPEQSNGG